MPNRILKESICTSDTLDHLTWFEEVFFYRLIVNADDYGLMDGRLQILKAKMFPLKTSVTDTAVQSALNKLATLGLVSTYMVEDKPYLKLLTWERHQQVRSTRAKYPQPTKEQLISSDINGYQMISDDITCSPNPIQSVSNPYPNPNPIYRAADKPQKPPKTSKPIKHQYGRYKNVLLEDIELEKLKNEYPDYLLRIEKLSEYIESKGAKYKSHLATIRAWARKDQENGGMRVISSSGREIKPADRADKVYESDANGWG